MFFVRCQRKSEDIPAYHEALAKLYKIATPYGFKEEKDHLACIQKFYAGISDKHLQETLYTRYAWPQHYIEARNLAVKLQKIKKSRVRFQN